MHEYTHTLLGIRKDEFNFQLANTLSSLQTALKD